VPKLECACFSAFSSDCLKRRPSSSRQPMSEQTTWGRTFLAIQQKHPPRNREHESRPRVSCPWHGYPRSSIQSRRAWKACSAVSRPPSVSFRWRWIGCWACIGRRVGLDNPQDQVLHGTHGRCSEGVRPHSTSLQADSLDEGCCDRPRSLGGFERGGERGATVAMWTKTKASCSSADPNSARLL